MITTRGTDYNETTNIAELLEFPKNERQENKEENSRISQHDIKEKVRIRQ